MRQHCSNGWNCPIHLAASIQHERKHDDGFHIAVVLYYKHETQGDVTSFEMGVIDGLPQECAEELKIAIRSIMIKHIGVRPS